MLSRKTHRNYFLRVSSGRGFTLVELLVVIAIIAVLVTVSFTVATKSIQRAKETNCLKNIKQIGTMMNGYAAENNGYYPEAGKTVGYITRLCENTFPSAFPARDDTNAVSQRQNFFESPTGKTFMCPSNKDGNKQYYKSYLANGRITGVLSAETPTKTYLNSGFNPKPVARVYDPSRALLIIEDWEKPSVLWEANDVHYIANSSTDAHRGGCHYLFVDGHAEHLTKDPGKENADAETIYYLGKDPNS